MNLKQYLLKEITTQKTTPYSSGTSTSKGFFNDNVAKKLMTSKNSNNKPMKSPREYYKFKNIDDEKKEGFAQSERFHSKEK